MSVDQSLYQEMILDHNKNPRNYKRIEDHTHHADGYNPLCGDHFQIYIKLDDNNIIKDVSFEGTGCAISKASASMMTTALKGKNKDEADSIFKEFQNLLLGKLDPDEDEDNDLGRLAVFSGIWQYPSRVKCANLAWHAMHGAINDEETASTE
jgi:nitrogen fixation protein NifU and related proteins